MAPQKQEKKRLEVSPSDGLGSSSASDSGSSDHSDQTVNTVIRILKNLESLRCDPVAVAEELSAVALREGAEEIVGRQLFAKVEECRGGLHSRELTYEVRTKLQNCCRVAATLKERCLYALRAFTHSCQDTWESLVEDSGLNRAGELQILATLLGYMFESRVLSLRVLKEMLCDLLGSRGDVYPGPRKVDAACTLLAVAGGRFSQRSGTTGLRQRWAELIKNGKYYSPPLRDQMKSTLQKLADWSRERELAVAEQVKVALTLHCDCESSAGSGLDVTGTRVDGSEALSVELDADSSMETLWEHIEEALGLPSFRIVLLRSDGSVLNERSSEDTCLSELLCPEA